jgi:hypothetical protein
VGLYQVRDGPALVLRAAAAGLTGQWQGAPPITLRAIGEDLFAARDDSFVLSFQREGRDVTSLVANRGGLHVLAQRLSRQAPALHRASIALDSTRLHDYTGDFRLDADTLVRVSATTTGLRLQLTGQEGLVLEPFATDRFAAADGSCVASFARDERGEVTALRLDLAGGEHTAWRTRWAVPSFHALGG